ncbi:hypothetical protein D9757_003339 [Collybiopsis confluens]|uniref:Uncharacterized protein n=1 Tax=Collybiopsis confluens TaxID=2823264 RepID=A0A8H5HYU3_9AGAR|nr:hypothetical protein D9757_003339 [Collybiopsis confluens]
MPSSATTTVYLLQDDNTRIPIVIPLNIKDDPNRLAEFLNRNKISDSGEQYSEQLPSSSSWDIDVGLSPSGDTLTRPPPSERHERRKTLSQDQLQANKRLEERISRLEEAVRLVDATRLEDKIAHLTAEVETKGVIGYFETLSRILQGFLMLNVQFTKTRPYNEGEEGIERPSESKKSKHNKHIMTIVKKALGCLSKEEHEMATHFCLLVFNLREARNGLQNPPPSFDEAREFVSSRITNDVVRKTALKLLDPKNPPQRMFQPTTDLEPGPQPLFVQSSILRYEATKESLARAVEDLEKIKKAKLKVELRE